MVSPIAVIMRHSSCITQGLYRECDVPFEKLLERVFEVWVTEWLVFLRVVKYKIPCVFRLVLSGESNLCVQPIDVKGRGRDHEKA